jgi:hypothetical protein
MFRGAKSRQALLVAALFQGRQKDNAPAERLLLAGAVQFNR